MAGLCLATDSPAPSGVGVHMLALARGMGAGATIVCRSDVPLFEQARAAGHRVEALETVEDRLAEYFRRQRFATVHVHAGIGWEGHPLVEAAKAAGSWVVRTEHLPWLLDDPSQVHEYHQVAGSVDRLIAVSHTVRASFIAGGVDPKRIVAIVNGVDAAEPNDGANPRALLGLGERKVVLHVGRFTEQKNHALLLAAMRDVVAELPDTCLLLVGEGDLAPAIARAIGQASTCDVRLLGQRDDVADLMAAADLLVLPSRFEGLPLVLLEAMAAGLAVVAARSPGVEEVIGSDTGWLVAPDDPEALAAAIVGALRDPDERRRRVAAATARQVATFSAERMREETRAHYRGDAARAPAAVKRTRVGFVGAGGIASRHLGVLTTMADVEVAAFADPDAALARRRTEEAGGEAFADVEQMLYVSALDAVYVCVPPFAHGPIEHALIDRNIPFFVEKPVAIASAVATPIAERIAAAELVTGVGFHWRYLDVVDELPNHLAGRAIRLASGYWLGSTPPPAWWGRKDRSGGQMVEQAIHLVDLARHLFGEAELVFGLTGHTSREAFPDLDVPTVSSASIRFSSGVIVNFAATCLLGWTHRVGLHAFGEGVAIEMTDQDIMVDVGCGRPVTPNRSDPVWREDRDFIDAVRGGPNRIRCDYGDAARTLTLVEAIERSAASGEAVHVAGAGA